MVKFFVNIVAGLLTGSAALAGTAIAGLLLFGDMGFIAGMVISPLFATLGFLGGFNFSEFFPRFSATNCRCSRLTN